MQPKKRDMTTSMVCFLFLKILRHAILYSLAPFDEPDPRLIRFLPFPTADADLVDSDEPPVAGRRPAGLAQ